MSSEHTVSCFAMNSETLNVSASFAEYSGFSYEETVAFKTGDITKCGTSHTPVE